MANFALRFLFIFIFYSLQMYLCACIIRLWFGVKFWRIKTRHKNRSFFFCIGTLVILWRRGDKFKANLDTYNVVTWCIKVKQKLHDNSSPLLLLLHWLYLLRTFHVLRNVYRVWPMLKMAIFFWASNYFNLPIVQCTQFNQRKELLSSIDIKNNAMLKS